jgi:hypothetical protein
VGPKTDLDDVEKMIYFTGTPTPTVFSSKIFITNGFDSSINEASSQNRKIYIFSPLWKVCGDGILI